jgi:hypothetical protein
LHRLQKLSLLPLQRPDLLFGCLFLLIVLELEANVLQGGSPVEILAILFLFALGLVPMIVLQRGIFLLFSEFRQFLPKEHIVV